MAHFEEVELVVATEEGGQIVKVRIEQAFECQECGKCGPWTEFITHRCQASDVS